MAKNQIRLVEGAGLFVASFALLAYGTGEPIWMVIALGLALALAAIALGAASLRASPPGR